MHHLFHKILYFMVLLGSVHESSTPLFECAAQAWVRAPDLVPNTIVRGDVGVKINAGCPVLKSLLLGLRLKERCSARALRSREDAEWMQIQYAADMLRLLLRTFPEWYTGDRSTRLRYEETWRNRSLWIDQDEERVVFQTTQLLHVQDLTERANYDIVRDFAILVPSTNFPPAPNYAHSEFYTEPGFEVLHAESVYEYFVLLSFSDGTTNEVPAGFTAFRPLFIPDHAPRLPRSGVMKLEAREGSRPETPRVRGANYTMQISAPSANGLLFTEGLEDQAVTVVVTRTGPASMLPMPLTIRGCIDPGFVPRWAVENGLLDLVPIPTPRHVLRSTPEDIEDAEQNSWQRGACVSRTGTQVSVVIPRPTPDKTQGNDIVTTNATVTVPIEVDRRLVSHFETYYQTFNNTLVITLRTPLINGEPIGSELWTGNLPVVVRSAVEDAQTRRCHVPSNSSLDVEKRDSNMGCEQTPPIHYLAGKARGPIFVNGSAVQELLARDPAERELLAPFLRPVVSSPAEDGDPVHRYFRDEKDPYRPFIYVGETWVKTRDEHWDMFTLHRHMSTVHDYWLKLPV